MIVQEAEDYPPKETLSARDLALQRYDVDLADDKAG